MALAIRHHQAKSDLFEHSCVSVVVMISASAKQGHLLLLSRLRFFLLKQMDF